MMDGQAVSDGRVQRQSLRQSSKVDYNMHAIEEVEMVGVGGRRVEGSDAVLWRFIYFYLLVFDELLGEIERGLDRKGHQFRDGMGFIYFKSRVDSSLLANGWMD